MNKPQIKIQEICPQFCLKAHPQGSFPFSQFWYCSVQAGVEAGVSLETRAATNAMTGRFGRQIRSCFLDCYDCLQAESWTCLPETYPPQAASKWLIVATADRQQQMGLWRKTGGCRRDQPFSWVHSLHVTLHYTVHYSVACYIGGVTTKEHRVEQTRRCSSIPSRNSGRNISALEVGRQPLWGPQDQWAGQEFSGNYVSCNRTSDP